MFSDVSFFFRTELAGSDSYPLRCGRNSQAALFRFIAGAASRVGLGQFTDLH
jgi:hypothetical protein